MLYRPDCVLQMRLTSLKASGSCPKDESRCSLGRFQLLQSSEQVLALSLQASCATPTLLCRLNRLCCEGVGDAVNMMRCPLEVSRLLQSGRRPAHCDCPKCLHTFCFNLIYSIALRNTDKLLPEVSPCFAYKVHSKFSKATVQKIIAS